MTFSFHFFSSTSILTMWNFIRSFYFFLEWGLGAQRKGESPGDEVSSWQGERGEGVGDEEVKRKR